MHTSTEQVKRQSLSFGRLASELTWHTVDGQPQPFIKRGDPDGAAVSVQVNAWVAHVTGSLFVLEGEVVVHAWLKYDVVNLRNREREGE